MICKNCQKPLEEQSDYCNRCGGKVVRKRLTMANLFSHFSETFLNYDNKFLQTCISLVKSPEDVINGYVNGVRKKYINPISFFAISITISGVYLYLLQNYFPEAMDFSNIYEDDTTQKISRKISNVVMEYNSFFYFALIPVLALFSRIVFLKKPFNYTEHIVIYFYTMSLGSVLSSLIGFIVLLLDPASMVFVALFMNLLLFLFHCYLLKRVFQLTISQLVLRSILFIVLFGVSYVIFSILMVIGLIVFTDVDLKDFAPKQ